MCKKIIIQIYINSFNDYFFKILIMLKLLAKKIYNKNFSDKYFCDIKYPLYVQTEPVYNNIYLHTGKVVKGEFENSICVNIHNELVVYSNDYLNNQRALLKHHTTFTDIINNYKDILEKKI